MMAIFVQPKPLRLTVVVGPSSRQKRATLIRLGEKARKGEVKPSVENLMKDLKNGE